MNIRLGGKVRSAEVTLFNREKVPFLLRAEAYDWSQDADGKDVMTPSKALLVFPKIVRILPDKKGVFRVGLAKASPTPAVEQVFRLIITQLPPTSDQELTSEQAKAVGAQITFLYRFSLPVSVPPANPKAEAVLVSATIQSPPAPAAPGTPSAASQAAAPVAPRSSANGEATPSTPASIPATTAVPLPTILRAVVNNPGNTSLVVSTAQFMGQDAAGVQVLDYSDKTASRILAGRSRSVDIPLSEGICSRLATLQYYIDVGKDRKLASELKSLQLDCPNP